MHTRYTRGNRKTSVTKQRVVAAASSEIAQHVRSWPPPPFSSIPSQVWAPKTSHLPFCTSTPQPAGGGSLKPSADPVRTFPWSSPSRVLFPRRGSSPLALPTPLRSPPFGVPLLVTPPQGSAVIPAHPFRSSFLWALSLCPFPLTRIVQVSVLDFTSLPVSASTLLTHLCSSESPRPGSASTGHSLCLLRPSPFGSAKVCVSQRYHLSLDLFCR